jgi:NADH-quinone oxidoreductase subunit J
MSTLLAAAGAAGTAGNVLGAGETAAFWILGPLAVIGALGMLLSRNAVHSALWLVLTMLCLGALYMVEHAPFLGFAQIIVYTGAIMMLFLFVLMMVGRDSSDSVVEVLRGQRAWAIALGLGLVALVGGGMTEAFAGRTPAGLNHPGANGGAGNVHNLARLIFTKYLFPFELTSALLITAAVGAMVLAHTGTRAGDRASQRTRVFERFRGQGAQPSPLPGPGVFATSDTVDTPALLPDGSIAEKSLSDLLDTAAAEHLGHRDEAAPGKQIAGETAGVDAHALTEESNGNGRNPEQPAGTWSEEAPKR